MTLKVTENCYTVNRTGSVSILQQGESTVLKMWTDLFTVYPPYVRQENITTNYLKMKKNNSKSSESFKSSANNVIGTAKHVLCLVYKTIVVNVQPPFYFPLGGLDFMELSALYIFTPSDYEP